MAAATLLVQLSWCSQVCGDQVHLTNGQTIEGIVVREDEAQIVLQVAWGGQVVLDRASLKAIERSDEKDRQALLARWREEDQAFKEREERERAFEESQRAKGLVFYRGQWVTKEEVEGIKAGVRAADEERHKREEAERQLKQGQEAREKLETELRALTERLRDMQQEQLRLQQEITSLRQVIIQRDQWRRRFSHIPLVVRDQFGNLLQVIVVDHGPVIELPDGSRCDLDVDGNRFTYIDHAGIHHQVELVTH